MSENLDTVFSLPAVDEDPNVELGVLLMGFGPERLLVGLGVAEEDPSADPATVTMYVDQLRHGVRDDRTIADALAAGARRWCAVRAALPATPGPRTAALRRQWTAAENLLAAAAAGAPELRTTGDAQRVYLVACWLRSAETTRIAEEINGSPRLTS